LSTRSARPNAADGRAVANRRSAPIAGCVYGHPGFHHVQPRYADLFRRDRRSQDRLATPEKDATNPTRTGVCARPLGCFSWSCKARVRCPLVGVRRGPDRSAILRGAAARARNIRPLTAATIRTISEMVLAKSRICASPRNMRAWRGIARRAGDAVFGQHPPTAGTGSFPRRRAGGSPAHAPARSTRPALRFSRSARMPYYSKVNLLPESKNAQTPFRRRHETDPTRQRGIQLSTTRSTTGMQATAR